MLYSFPFIAMASANFFMLSSVSTFVLLPLFLSARGASQSDVGIIMGTYTLSSVLCRPWISRMIDRIGRKRSFTLGSLVLVISPLLYLFAQGQVSELYPALLAIRALHGLGLAICITAAFTYASDIIPPERLNEGIGVFGISGLSGLALGAPLAEVIIRYGGFGASFQAASALALLGLAVHLRLPETFLHNAGGPSAASFTAILRKRSVQCVILTGFLFGFGIAASSHFVSPFASMRQLHAISAYYVAYSAAAIASRLLGGRFADRVGEGWIIPKALILTGCGLWVLILLEGPLLLVVSGLMTGCGHGLLFPSLAAFGVRNEPGEVRGTIVGSYMGGVDAGVFVGSILLGTIGEWAGFQALFAAAGLALFAGLIPFRLLGAEHPLPRLACRQQ